MGPPGARPGAEPPDGGPVGAGAEAAGRATAAEGAGAAGAAGAMPVRLPGAIQPHGFLLGVDPSSLVVRSASANLRSFLGVEAGYALGRTLIDLLGTAVVDRLPVPGPSGRRDTEPRTVRLPPPPADGAPPVGAAARGVEPAARERWNEFEVIAHRTSELWVLEFEPATADETGLRSLHDSFRRTLDHLRTLDGVAALCGAATEELRSLTGYDRVVVHRFGPDASREVIAEARRPAMDSLLGLSYPASAMSAESRDRHLRAWLRLIADVDADPVALLSSPDRTAAGDVDLTMSALRSASPAGRLYLRRLGVAARMTISLVIDGRLWGLIVCDHASPRRISQHVQASCEVLGRVLSLQVRAALARLEQERVSRLDAMVAEVVTAMSLADSLGAGAVEVPDALLGMVDSDGVVLQVEGHRVSAGRVPEAADIDALVDRVVTLAADGVLPWTTDALPRLLKRAGLGGTAGGGLATGVLYLPFGGRGSGYALWLRTEEVRTIAWAADPGSPGDPGDRGDPGSSGQAGSPGLDGAPARRPGGLAAAREEVVRGTSRPWWPAELAAAETFAGALPAYMLHRAQRVLIEQQLAATAERLSAAEQRQELEHQLQQHQRLESLGQLAGGVAHDFNNLLAVILNYAEFVGDEIDIEAGSGDGDRWRAAQADVEQIKVATRRAADLTKQLLAFARREVVQPRVLNLNHVVRGLEHLLRRTIGERVELRINLAEHLDLVLADPGQVEQILVNLAVNARDAMPAGGVLVIDTADLDPSGPTPPAHRTAGEQPAPATAALTGRYVRLRVHDTGTGIPQAIIDRVFEPFFTTKPTGDGTGLGLATVHGIVTQIGGTIEIDSSASGTTFSIVLPSTAAPAPPAAERAAPPRPQRGGETVLVVEDGQDLREVTRRLLERAGYQVLSAADGYEAIEAAAQHPTPVDLLLTDLIMPFMTGDEVASRMRGLYPGIRILFMSGYATPILGAADRGEPDYPLLDKPFSRSALLMKVLEVLDDPPLSMPADRTAAAKAGAGPDLA